MMQTPVGEEVSPAIPDDKIMMVSKDDVLPRYGKVSRKYEYPEYLEFFGELARF
jgi:hypothetical protein